MNKFSRYLAVASSVMFAICAPAVAAQEKPSLAIYGELPGVEDAAISPSGTNIAVLMSSSGIRQLVFLNAGMEVIENIAVGEAKVRYLDWVGDNQLLLVTSQTEDLWGFTTDKAEFSVATLIPVNGEGEMETVFARTKNLLNSVRGNYGIRRVNGEWLAYFGAIELKRTPSARSGYGWNHGRPYLYSVETASNRTQRVANAARDGTYRDWVIDARGQVAATLDLDLANGNWSIEGPDGETLVSGNQRLGRISLVGLGYDGSELIYSERDENDASRRFSVPLAGGTPAPFLEDADVERFYWDETTGYLVGYLDETEGPVFRNPQLQSAVRGIRKAFADHEMRMIDWSPDFNKVLVRTSGNRDSGSWFVVDVAAGKAEAIAYERDAIGPDEVGPISTFAYTAGDGLEMDGILTLPPGREAKNLPVIMLPHGGPHAHDSESFDWWAQAFASRGYAVFQPNFRGSTNRDAAFRRAGYGEWGRKMQTDISDGLAALAQQGIIDPDRACIVGASYGGYAALAGVTLQQGVYQCAVAVAPVSDLTAMFNEDYRASGNLRLAKSSLLEQLGPKDGWDAVSPRRYADRADAPILLIHGVDDTVVPFSHSHKMADKLKDAGKPHELIKLDEEDHWLSRSSTRRQMLEAAVKFVEEHNPPR